MKYRSLGKGSLDVSEIGLGTEYLWRQSPEAIKQTVEFAINAASIYLTWYSHFRLF